MKEKSVYTSHEQIAAYNKEWPSLYKAEALELRKIFGDKLLEVEHIGSTSVPGLASKPIIDIMVLIENHSEADKFIPELEKLGYMFDAEVHSKTQFPERHFFRKGSPAQYHLSIAYADKGSFWKRQLAFRDYLRSHSDERDRYATLKQELITKDPTGKNSYIGGKTDLINEMLDKSGFVRWKPATDSD